MDRLTVLGNLTEKWVEHKFCKFIFPFFNFGSFFDDFSKFRSTIALVHCYMDNRQNWPSLRKNRKMNLPVPKNRILLTDPSLLNYENTIYLNPYSFTARSNFHSL